MADDCFPTEYDALVLGTGMTECIIAAALSRIGLRVLHLDRNDYYSGDWGTFHFEALRTWISERSESGKTKSLPTVDIQKQKELLEEGEDIIPLCINSSTVANVKETVHIPEDHPVSPCDPEKETQQKSEAEEKVEKELDTGDQQSCSAKETFAVKPPADDEEVKKEELVVDSCDPETEENISEDISEKNEEMPASIPEQEKKAPSKEEEKKTWCFNEMKKQWRQFNVDLQPKILYCYGPLVELLISSDIAKYCEFKSVTRILTLLDDVLQQVPCSRADVFSSRLLSMIEKRMLMKFLTFSVEYENHPAEYQGFENKTFEEFLKARKLTANVCQFIKCAIAMTTPKATTLEGLLSTRKFLRSLGRYGNTAFLWPLYGSGELPQCFCRMCAVFGGVYCLRRTGVSLIVDKDKTCKGVIDTEGIRLNAKYVIAESSYTTNEMIDKTKKKSISRGIFVTDKSLRPSDTEHISLLMVPPGDGREELIKVLELCPSSHACPRNTYLVHMTCEGYSGPEEDLAPATANLFQPSTEDSLEGVEEEETRPRVLWSLYFSQEDTSQVALDVHGIAGLHVVASPDTGLDFDLPITQARAIFEKLCPGEEFLPRAPNPEDIIYDYDQQGPNTEGSGFEPKEESKTETVGTTEGNAEHISEIDRPTEGTKESKSEIDGTTQGRSETKGTAESKSGTEETKEGTVEGEDQITESEELSANTESKDAPSSCDMEKKRDEQQNHEKNIVDKVDTLQIDPVNVGKEDLRNTDGDGARETENATPVKSDKHEL